MSLNRLIHNPISLGRLTLMLMARAMKEQTDDSSSSYEASTEETFDPAGARQSHRRLLLYMTLALIVVDIAMIVIGFLGGYYIRFLSGFFPFEEFQPLRGHFGALVLQLAIAPLVLGATGLYRPLRSVSWLDHSYHVFAAISVTTALNIVVGAFIWIDAPFSRLMTAIIWTLTVLLVMFGRMLLHTISGFFFRNGFGIERVLVIGSGEAARLVLDKIRHSPRMGYRVVGAVVDDQEASALDGVPTLGTIDQIGSIVQKSRAEGVFIAMPSLSRQGLLDIVSQCAMERVNIKVYPDLFQLMTSGVDIGDLAGLPLLSVKDVALRGWNLALKRSMDIVVSAAILVVLSPVFMLIGLIVRLTSPGAGVFYCQERVGLDGKPFQVIKFRTMRPDAEAKTGPVWASEGDSRRTAFGALLRRTSLDEFPQFINVLIGEMSLVGPRPERTVFVEQFRQSVPRYFERHSEKAGITGWAQVNGLRGNTSIEERTAYDIWYVENWTLWLDIKIILKTFTAVFKGDNAY